MLNWLIDVSLRYRGWVILASLLFAAVGAYAVLHVDVDAFPDTTSIQVQVNTAAPALAADEVERQITAPVEQALAGVPHLHELRSTSKFAVSQVTAVFEDGTDVLKARQHVQERLAALELPAGAPRPMLGPISTGLGEIFHYVLRYRGLDLSQLPEAERIRRLTELRTLHDWVVRPKLRTVRGVAEVNSWGGYERQYQVRVDPLKLAQFKLSLDQVADALAKANQNVGAGNVRRNSESLLIQGVGRAANLDQIRDTPLTARDGVPLRVRDVAEVTLGQEIRRGAVTAQGQGEAVLGLGFMLMGENSHDVAYALREKLDEVRPLLPPEVEVEVVYDRTELVNYVIDTVRRNLFEGGLLVIAVLFAFLGNLRAAAIVALAIPLSMLCAFSGMARFGIAASLLSLGAIDFGMIVDSSVVMVENCVRHIAHGDLKTRPHLEVIRDAAVEVRKPTLFGELIIIIVYLPILTLEGAAGKMFRPMALTVIFALVGSMVLSLTLMPALASLFLPRKIVEREPWPMRVAHALHAPLLKFSMEHRVAVLMLAAAALVFAFGIIAPGLGAEFIPELSEGAIAINVVRVPGTDLEESIRGNTLMEKALLEHFPDEVRHLWARIGTAEVATDPMGLEVTDFYVTLYPRGQWKRAATQERLTEEIQKLLRKFPGQKLEFEQPIQLRISEMETGVRTDISVKLYGDDLDVLLAKGKEVEAVLKAIPGAADVAVEPITAQPVLQVRPRLAEIARFGLSTQEVLAWVQALGGIPAGDILDGPIRVPLAIRLPEAYGKDPSKLRNLLIPTAAGERLPLSLLADVEQVEGPSSISREAGQRRVAVSANVRGRDVGTFVDEARQAVAARVALPSERYSLRWTGTFEHYDRARLRLMIVVPVSLVMIFLLLYMTYGNFIDSLRVLTGVPLGWVGGIVALWLRGMPFSIPAAVGFVALSGVAVLDDMILISYVRQLRRRGLDVTEAVRQAAITRLRPVLMTTLVASLGFVPMALSQGTGAEVQRPLATVVIGGVIGAMVMSLLVLRVLYLVFDGIAHGLYRFCVHVVGTPAAVAAGWFGLAEEKGLSPQGDEG